MKRLGQGGFATLEVILMVTVIGILAAIAVPRFEDITAKANTARIQSDLTTIDTAIALYQMNETTALAAGDSLSKLSKYLTDAESIKPPQSGKCYIGSNAAKEIPAKDYTIETSDGSLRAVLGTGNTAGKFYYIASST